MEQFPVSEGFAETSSTDNGGRKKIRDAIGVCILSMTALLQGTSSAKASEPEAVTTMQKQEAENEKKILAVVARCKLRERMGPEGRKEIRQAELAMRALGGDTSAFRELGLRPGALGRSIITARLSARAKALNMETEDLKAGLTRLMEIKEEAALRQLAEKIEQEKNSEHQTAQTEQGGN